jgi:hypothetical protein
MGEGYYLVLMNPTSTQHRMGKCHLPTVMAPPPHDPTISRCFQQFLLTDTEEELLLHLTQRGGHIPIPIARLVNYLLSSSTCMSASDSGSLGGHPSITHPTPPPCDSPNVVTRNTVPYVFPVPARTSAPCKQTELRSSIPHTDTPTLGTLSKEFQQS